MSWRPLSEKDYRLVDGACVECGGLREAHRVRAVYDDPTPGSLTISTAVEHDSPLTHRVRSFGAYKKIEATDLTAAMMEALGFVADTVAETSVRFGPPFRKFQTYLITPQPDDERWAVGWKGRWVVPIAQDDAADSLPEYPAEGTTVRLA